MYNLLATKFYSEWHSIYPYLEIVRQSMAEFDDLRVRPSLAVQNAAHWLRGGGLLISVFFLHFEKKCEVKYIALKIFEATCKELYLN